MDPLPAETGTDPNGTPAAEGRLPILLSPREYSIVKSIHQGLETAEIAAYLGIGYPTVKVYISKIMIFTRVKNRVMLALYFERGYFGQADGRRQTRRRPVLAKPSKTPPRRAALFDLARSLGMVK